MVDDNSDVFISYSHKDRDLVRRLEDSLRERGWSVTSNNLERQPGDEWRAVIEEAIASAQVVLLLITPNYLAYDLVERQVPYLLTASRKRGAVVLPILGDAVLSAPLAVFNLFNPEHPVREMRPRELNAFGERLSREITGLVHGEPSAVVRHRPLESSFEPEVYPQRDVDPPDEEVIPRKRTPSRRAVYVRAQDVVEALGKATGASVELSQCFLAAWVGLLRYTALETAEEQGHLSEFLDQVRSGDGALRVSPFLAPQGWNQDAFVRQISRDIHLRPEDTDRMLNVVCQALVMPADPRGLLEFEPLGIIRRIAGNETQYEGEKLAPGFSIELRGDFFDPQMHDPVTVEETQSADECGESYIGA